MRTRAPYIACLAMVASLVPALANAGAWLPARGEYYSEISAAREFADTYYDKLGARYPFPLSVRREQRRLTFYNELGWKKSVSVQLGIPLVSETLNAPDFRYSSTETGFGDVQVGFRFKLHDGRTALALQSDYIAPAGYQTRTSPTLGGNAAVAEQQLLYGTGLKSWNMIVEAGLGYRSYFVGRRSELTGAVTVSRWFGSSLLVSGHCYSLQTLAATKDSPEDFRYNRVGPELRYRVDDRLDVFVGSDHLASGRNVDHPDTYYAGVAYRQSKRDRLQGLLGNKTRP
jgi:hypothetical protein